MITVLTLFKTKKRLEDWVAEFVMHFPRAKILRQGGQVAELHTIGTRYLLMSGSNGDLLSRVQGFRPDRVLCYEEDTFSDELKTEIDYIRKVVSLGEGDGEVRETAGC